MLKPNMLAACILASAVVSGQASALNIVLTNDDSWHTANIQVMFSALKAAGHNVIMSAPCTGQSGKGGAVSFLKPVKVDNTKATENQYCVGDTDTTKPFASYVEGTPIMAALQGIDIAAHATWGKAPDLLISGPNEGNNLGYLNNSSGTLGAAMIAIIRGIPAIAVSAADGDAEKAPKVAQIIVDLIQTLESERQANQPLLPPFMGLNVNTPADIDNHRGIKFTQVGWNSGLDVVFRKNLGQDPSAIGYVAQGIMAAKGVDKATAEQMAIQMLMDRSGISISRGEDLVKDNADDSEGVALYQGYVTISTIDAQIQASQAKAALTQLKLHKLTQ
ncbi:5'/3'-nucleotidase SurE [Shewanella baltica]|uniref:5'/3'-nucleotidase SurE n=1 Tax=Shewanella baltica TaxID=62322 RepID=UPI00217DF8A3|nr:5'/3'-nucleotidase SurE [Shewanella baltica]